MPDLGSIGTLGGIALASTVGPPWWWRGVAVVGEDRLVVGARDDSIGSGGGASLRFDRPGVFIHYWPVDAGARSYTVAVRKTSNTSPRPKVRVIANPAIGVGSDVEATVPTGLNLFQDVTINVSPTGSGVLEVRYEVQTMEESAQVWFSNIRVT